MIKFKITPARFAEACSILDYLGASAGNIENNIRIAPRFVVNTEGEYIVKVTLDDDGDISALENVGDALMEMAKVTPKRLEKLSKELTEAAKAIVNPPNEGG